MDKSQIVKIGHLSFRKDSAKGTTIEQFKKSYSNKAFDTLDKEKAFVLLGGKLKESKKKEENK